MFVVLGMRSVLWSKPEANLKGVGYLHNIPATIVPIHLSQMWYLCLSPPLKAQDILKKRGQRDCWKSRGWKVLLWNSMIKIHCVQVCTYQRVNLKSSFQKSITQINTVLTAFLNKARRPTRIQALQSPSKCMIIQKGIAATKVKCGSTERCDSH